MGFARWQSRVGASQQETFVMICSSHFRAHDNCSLGENNLSKFPN